MARLGCLLMVVAMVLLFAIIVIPVLPFVENNATIDGYLTPLMCRPNERIERDLYSGSSRQGGTTFSMGVYCIDNENQRRDETGRWMMIGTLGFILPFLIGIFTYTGGGGTSKATHTATPHLVVTQDDESLSDKLREIKQAHDAGLISSEEYQSLRQKILDEEA